MKEEKRDTDEREKKTLSGEKTEKSQNQGKRYKTKSEDGQGIKRKVKASEKMDIARTRKSKPAYGHLLSQWLLILTVGDWLLTTC